MLSKSKRYLLIGVGYVLGFIGTVFFSLGLVFITVTLTIKEVVDATDT